VLPFIGLCVLLGVGHLLRMRIRLLRRLYLPSCVIGGLAGLVILQVANAADAPVPGEWTAGWGKLPGLLINVVFACLFLGVALPKPSTLWRRAGPQLAYGQVVAWGQYVVGVGLVLVLLGPLFHQPAMFGGIIPVGFEGGHGTAGGMGPVFEKLGWPEGKDFGLASATAGIISAIVVGMILVNWAARKGYTVRRRRVEEIAEDDAIGVIPLGRRPEAGRLTVRSDAIEAFTLHVALVGVAVLLGWLMKQGLWQIEHLANAGRRLPFPALAAVGAVGIRGQQHHAVAEVQHGVQVVGRHDHGQLEACEQLDELAAVAGVEVGGRLVEGEHLGRHGQHGGHAHALALAEAQMMRGPLGRVTHVHFVKGLCDPTLYVGTVEVHVERAEGYVVEDGGHEELVVRVLEDEPHLQAHLFQPAVVHGDAADRHSPGAVQQAVQVQKQRGLAGPVRADQGHPFARRNGQAYAPQGLRAVRISEAQAFDGDHLTHARTPQAKSAAATATAQRPFSTSAGPRRKSSRAFTSPL